MIPGEGQDTCLHLVAVDTHKQVALIDADAHPKRTLSLWWGVEFVQSIIDGLHRTEGGRGQVHGGHLPFSIDEQPVSEPSGAVLLLAMKLVEKS
jgi:hypothetical protein